MNDPGEATVGQGSRIALGGRSSRSMATHAQGGDPNLPRPEWAARLNSDSQARWTPARGRFPRLAGRDMPVRQGAAGRSWRMSAVLEYLLRPCSRDTAVSAAANDGQASLRAVDTEHVASVCARLGAPEM